MKIAIQGHATRFKEVIDTLVNLGGINKHKYTGDNFNLFYYIDECNHIEALFLPIIDKNLYKCYTLEKFEKEFPFKIGDKVIILDYSNKKGTIVSIEPCGPILLYFIKLETGNGIYKSAKHLKPYNKMKEERNITLTLDKAKEWYNKGGELKEIALQAFTKEELNPLPKSWEEYCKMYPIQAAQCLSVAGCPNKYIALYKLELLRDCYRQGWEPNWTLNNPIVSIYSMDKRIGIVGLLTRHFLSFQSEEIAKEFKKNFESLILEAEEFI